MIGLLYGFNLKFPMSIRTLSYAKEVIATFQIRTKFRMRQGGQVYDLRESTFIVVLCKIFLFMAAIPLDLLGNIRQATSCKPTALP